VLAREHRSQSSDKGFGDAVASLRRAESGFFFVAFFDGSHKVFCDVVEGFGVGVRVAETRLDFGAVEFELGGDGGEVYDAAVFGEEGDECLAHL